MSGHRMIGRAMQQALVRAAAEQAIENLTARLQTNGEQLVELMIERAFSELGDEYGDATFHLTEHQQVGEGDQELADAIFYESCRIQRPVVAQLVEWITQGEA